MVGQQTLIHHFFARLVRRMDGRQPIFINHLEMDERGLVYIKDCRSKVKQIVIDTLAGYSPAEIHENYSHLSMSETHAALAYYYDHKEQIDAEIARQDKEFEEWKAKHGNSIFRQQLLNRLRTKGMLLEK